MARKYQSAAQSGYTVLVVDDSPEIIESTRRLLAAEGHRVLTAATGQAGLELLEREAVQVILVDYFMPEMTGEEFVRRVRTTNQLVQIILATGYSGEKPARVMMRQLDIQGYHDKSEGAERLLLWVDTALKSYRHVLAMEKHRTGLRYLLDITPELHRFQPIHELLQCLLWQIEGLLGAENSFVATFAPDYQDKRESEGFVALVDTGETGTGLHIRFGTGRFASRSTLSELDGFDSERIQEALRSGTVLTEGGASIVPLRYGDRPVGVIYLDRHRGQARDQELLEVYANQAAAAIQNSLLYDMATTDPLTGVYLRGFALLQLHQAIKRATRRGEQLSLLMIDLDKFKLVNDSFGHQAGDRVLAAVGGLLRDCLRETDVVGRYGGDEFIVVLPGTSPAAAVTVAERVLARTRNANILEREQRVPLSLSVGVSTLALDPTEADHMLDGRLLRRVATELIHAADQRLYSSKGSGSVAEPTPLRWEQVVEQAPAA